MRRTALWLTAALACGLGQTACTNQNAPLQSEAMTQAENNWTVYGGDLSNTRYAVDDQINAGNVKDLHLKWIFQTGITGSFETTPIVEDGVMYITTPYNHVFAIDARTGEQLWHYEYKLRITLLCCGPNNRGVAVAGDKVYMATLDAMLVALDKKTGGLAWETEIADPEFGYSETGAPTVYENKVIVGISGAEYGIRGFISAYDKDNGALVWRWYTIPEPNEVQPDGTKGWYGTFNNLADGINPLHRDLAAEKAAMSRYADAWRRGGGSNWMTNAVDPERGILYAAIGNPSPDLYAEVRPGDNRWTESLVALNVNTGKLVWGYQFVPHDPWDFDAVSPPILADVTGRDGRTLIVPAVIHGGKTGWVYVNNRETGELIRRSAAMVQQENLFTPPTEEGVRMLPGANGGVEWSPGSFNPNTRMVYYENLHQPMTYTVKKEPWRKGKLWLGGAFTVIPGADQWGNVSAVNVDTGQIVWQARTDDPMVGGTLTTAGNLVFAGEGNGHFNAYNATTGEQLWTFQAGAGVNAAPMSFTLDGKQYVAVAAGGNFQLNYKLGDSLLVFGLD
jgi:alcohol dehydrogenase (cytochrome c)